MLTRVFVTVPLEELDGGEEYHVRMGTASLNGMFSVPDARTATDHAGRKIITAQDFVRQHAVQSVFGFGGTYLHDKTFAAVILFAREHLDEATAGTLMPLASVFKTLTLRLMEERHIFCQVPGEV